MLLDLEVASFLMTAFPHINFLSISNRFCELCEVSCVLRSHLGVPLDRKSERMFFVGFKLPHFSARFVLRTVGEECRGDMTYFPVKGMKRGEEFDGQALSPERGGGKD